jgi:hypothetical protein
MEQARQCDHDGCPGGCLYQGLSWRKDEFWRRWRAREPASDMGVDPVAWLEGLYED